VQVVFGREGRKRGCKLWVSKRGEKGRRGLQGALVLGSACAHLQVGDLQSRGARELLQQSSLLLQRESRGGLHGECAWVLRWRARSEKGFGSAAEARRDNI
jgi:hypothetical protein